MAVNNRGIGICIQNLGSKESNNRKGAATLISAISQNYPKIQKKTIHLLPLLLKIANDENDQDALRAEVCQTSQKLPSSPVENSTCVKTPLKSSQKLPLAQNSPYKNSNN